ncbi:hypothetical protein CEUSTIGMA_g10544.t1 [Chlamydomonas eustigma]|uniref:DNA mismatch repair proteins mutS family domain-containing protein n=1 Tax=Chlamydomonas eustigma TaxID=1157962 RepID=A0A250XJ67_9CHLO|nr:hypothetical protein CEUSTIGMA_g10544.t1 [Chlamydomonas eustigma]|eukprot:GAX83118.1 hypothetical protein CEUSTIGMA_g10544.t1 [Chlamydomonas eustigma]
MCCSQHSQAWLGSFAAPIRGPRSASTIAAVSSRRGASSVKPVPLGDGDDMLVMSAEDQQFWNEMMQRVDLPELADLRSRLDSTHPVGIRRNSRTLKREDGVRSLGLPCYSYFCEVKKQYPKYVVLAKIGDFYETLGFDALLLCQFAKTNPMSPRSGVARAGVPIQNMPRAVRALNAADISVVVCSEIPSGRYGQPSPRKDRTIMGVSTPANPMILYSAVEDGGLSEEVYAEGLPLIGVASSKAGYIFFEYRHELRTILVSEQLSAETLMSKLYAQRAAPPLLVHSSVKEVASLGSSTGRVELLIKAYAKGVLNIKSFTSDNPLQGFKNEVKLEMSLHPREGLRVLTAEKHKDGRPLAPYLSTINNLGLNNSPGMPTLLEAALPSRTPPESRRWLEGMLRQPPPPAQALALHQACRTLAEQTDPIPNLSAAMSIKKVSEVILVRQGNENFFRELVGVLLPVIQLMHQPGLNSLVDGLMTYVDWDLQMHVEKEDLLQTGNSALQEIMRVVDMDGSGATGLCRERDSGSESDAESSSSSSSTASSSGRSPPSDGGLALALRRLQSENERFRGKVNPDIIKKQLKQVDTLRLKIEVEVSRIMKRLMAASSEGKDPMKYRPSCKYHDDDRTVWLSLVHLSKATKLKDELQLYHPTDRKGSTVTGSVSTQQLDVLLAEYREATDRAALEVKAQLYLLCETLDPWLKQLMTCTQASIVGRALMEHVDEAVSRSWCLPELEAVQKGELPKGPPRLEVTGMWPYWKDVQAPDTVINDLVLDRIILLTGPNMAGKSTILRSIAAVAILGNCGLLVPAESATIPFYDAYMLRNFSGDSPLEGLSSFALEMVDVKAVLRDATARSLILLDEMGKGTEVLAATSLSGALLEQLGDRGCTAVFATHLHDLVGLMREREQEGQIVNMCMEVVEDKTVQGDKIIKALAPTWRIVPGHCFESLAFQVSQDYGVQSQVVHRAMHLFELLSQGRPLKLLQDAQNFDKTSSANSVESLEGNGISSHASLLSNLQLGAGSNGSYGHKEDQSAGSESEESSSEPSSTSSAPEEVHTIEEASMVLKSVLIQILQQEEQEILLEPSSPPESSNRGHDPILHLVGPGQRWPASHLQRSAVYIVRYSSGWFYCGETDNVKKRLKDHSTRMPSVCNHRGPGLQFLYTLIGEEAKSRARQIESACIKALRKQNFPLVSDADANHKSFGRSTRGRKAKKQMEEVAASTIGGDSQHDAGNETPVIASTSQVVASTSQIVASTSQVVAVTAI